MKKQLPLNKSKVKKFKYKNLYKDIMRKYARIKEQIYCFYKMCK